MDFGNLVCAPLELEILNSLRYYPVEWYYLSNVQDCKPFLLKWEKQFCLILLDKTTGGSALSSVCFFSLLRWEKDFVETQSQLPKNETVFRRLFKQSSLFLHCICSKCEEI